MTFFGYFACYLVLRMGRVERIVTVRIASVAGRALVAADASLHCKRKHWADCLGNVSYGTPKPKKTLGTYLGGKMQRRR